MALFKISKGVSSRIPALNRENTQDGWCWFTTDDGLFHIDYEDNGVLQRKTLNANDAKTLTGASMETGTTISESATKIPTSKMVNEALGELRSDIQDNYNAITDLEETKMNKVDPQGSGKVSINGTATGDKAVAFGGTAEGANSFSLGTSTAEGANSFSLGASTAKGIRSFAGGSASAEGSNTFAFGISAQTTQDNAFAFGNNAKATGISAVSFGNEASGQSSFAEGSNTIAQGTNSHSAGFGTKASHKSQFVIGEFNTIDNSDNPPTSRGKYAFIIGKGTGDSDRKNALTVTWDGSISHEGRYAGGNEVEATGLNSHAEGNHTSAQEDYSHAEGSHTTASGEASHAEGNSTTANGTTSHAEGYGMKLPITITGEANATTYTTNAEQLPKGVVYYNGIYAIITSVQYNENDTCTFTVDRTLSSIALSNVQVTLYTGIAFGDYSHTEGALTAASGRGSHAEGMITTAEGEASHAEGGGTTAKGLYSHAEGCGTLASGNYSHAEGETTIASEYSSHAEGNATIASGLFSHAEGYLTEANGTISHAEGSETLASGLFSHAEGDNTIASGYVSHAGGKVTEANGSYSFTHGYYLTAKGESQAVFGKYNASNTTDIFQIGGGTSDTDRKNIFSIDTDGDAKIEKSLNIGGLPTDLMAGYSLGINGYTYFNDFVSVSDNYTPTEDNHLVNRKFVTDNLPNITHIGITATEGQNVFDFSTVGLTDLSTYYLVFYDGLLLMEGMHYNITDKYKVSLLDWTAPAGHMIHVLGFKPIQAASMSYDALELINGSY